MQPISVCLSEYYITPGPIDGTLILPGTAIDWPPHFRNLGVKAHNQSEYYGGFLVAESICFSALQYRLAATWNAAKGIKTEDLKHDQIATLRSEIDTLKTALSTVQKHLTTGMGHHHRAIVINTIENALNK